MRLPNSIQDLIEQFTKLPTIGRKSAERFVFHLLRQPQSRLDAFAAALQNLKRGVRNCTVCGALSEPMPTLSGGGALAEAERCTVCADAKRDAHLLCVVSSTRDVVLLEKTKSFSGYYHVLGGLIDTAREITPEQLNIQPLLQRVQGGTIQEIILALSPTFEGETTTLYLTNLLKNSNLKVTRLARGLPTGADIEYADETTLSHALENRR